MKPAFVLSGFAVILSVFAFFINPAVATTASTATWTTQADFDAGEKVNVDTSEDKVSLMYIFSKKEPIIQVSSNIGISGSINIIPSMHSSIIYNFMNNQFLVVWYHPHREFEYRESKWWIVDYWKLYGRIINANGTFVSPEIVISSKINNDGYGHPAVVYTPQNNQYIVLYSSGPDRELYSQKINPDGTLSGPATMLWSNACAYSITYNSVNNQLLVAIRENEGDIVGQIINADGTVAIDRLEIISQRTQEDNRNFSITYNPTGNQFIITWQHKTEPDDNYNIRARIINADGTLGHITEITPRNNGESNPQIAYNSQNNQYMISYNRTYRNIYAKIIDANINFVDSEILIYNGSDIIVTPTPSTIIYNSKKNKFIVGWAAYTFSYFGYYNEGFTTLAQIVNADGSLFGDNFAVANEYANLRPSISYNPLLNEFFIAYAQFIPSWGGGSSELRARIIDTYHSSPGIISGLKINAEETKAKWNAISWSGETPENTSIKCRTRGADTEGGLADAAWSDYYAVSGSPITTTPSKWLEVELTLESTDGTNTPVLHDVTINYRPYDITPPEITVLSPEQRDYQISEDLTISYSATDDLSGVASVSATLGGQTIENGQEVDLYALPIGQHTFTVTATDNAGNTSTKEVIFNTVATPESTISIIEELLLSGEIASSGIANSLTSRLENALSSIANDNTNAAIGQLNAFINQVNAQADKKIDSDAAILLIQAAQNIIDNPRQSP